MSFDPTRGGLLVVNDEDSALTDLDVTSIRVTLANALFLCVFFTKKEWEIF